MPVVNRYGQRKVDLEALPGVRKTAAETPESMGAGVSQATADAALSKGRGSAQKAGAAAQLGGQVAQIGLAEASRMAEEARRAADHVSIMAAKNSLARWETDRIYGEKGALTRKGKDALGEPEAVDAEFTALTGEIEKTLNQRQLAAFQEVKGQARENVHATLQRHVFGEMQTYTHDEWSARVETSTNLIVANSTDFRRAANELKDLEADTIQAAPALGLGPAKLQATLDGIRGAVHSQIVDKLLTEGGTTGGKLDAQLYYEEAKGQITDPKQREKIEKALGIGNVRKDGKAAADQIIAEGGSQTEMLKKAGALDRVEVSDEAHQRIKEYHAIKRNEEGQAQSDLLDNVYTKLRQSGGTYRPTPSEVVQLGTHIAAVDNYAESLVQGKPTKTDPAVYYALLQQAHEDPASFVASGNNLLTFSSRLSEGDLKGLMNTQIEMRSAKPAKLLDDYRTEAGIINDALAQAGLEPTPGDKDPEGKARVARFHSLLAEEVRRVVPGVAEGTKVVTHDELAAIAKRLLGKQITTKGWFWQKDQTKPLSKATLDDIPKDQRKQVEAALREDGLPITDDNIIVTWSQHQRQKAKP